MPAEGRLLFPPSFALTGTRLASNAGIPQVYRVGPGRGYPSYGTTHPCGLLEHRRGVLPGDFGVNDVASAAVICQDSLRHLDDMLTRPFSWLPASCFP